MNALPELASADATRETRVQRTAARRPTSGQNPVRVFVDKERLAFFWFLIAVLAIGCAIGSPFYLISKFKERERVVIVDPAGTYYISPLLDFQEAKELHAQQTTLATVALLDRNPKGFDNPELIKQMFLKIAYAKALKEEAAEENEFKSKQLHQKVEIAQIDILETRENFVLTQVTGQLIRTGV
ncbi:MAG: hypothetical protein ABI680_11100, partial [Chthoniobacteraceae bacterium]